MQDSTLTVATVYRDLVEKVQQKAQQAGETWRSWVDPSTLSPAQYGEVSQDQVAWWPTPMASAVDFNGVERGLEIQLNDQFKQFFGMFYGGGLPVIHSRGNAELLMVWHDPDAERLQQNLIAHLLMKRQLKQRETLFFAVTDDDDFMISVLNSTGEVYLEQVGREVQQKLADSLVEFLQQLSPRQG
jgi:SecY interacting protein Syd